ncbi:MAG: HEAT repeat domain-containing protein [Fidelibacterota bacterium]
MITGSTILYVLIFTTGLIFLSTLALAGYTLLLRYRNYLKGQTWKRLEARWEPHLLAVLSGSKPPGDMREVVDEGEGLYFVDFVERYARRVRGGERDLLSETVRPYLAPVKNSVARGDPEQRARAVQTLNLLGFNDYHDVIIEALEDPSPLVAMIAARSLMRREHPRFTEDVIKKMHRFSSWSRNFLASMLASVGPDASPALRGALRDPSQPPWVRTVCADALIQLNDLQAADLAATLIQSEQDRELAAACLRILARLGREEHVPSIRPLCDSSDFVIRAHAVRAISRLAPFKERELIESALKDSSSWVAIQAAQGLKESGALDILRDIALTDHPRADLAKQILSEKMR